MSRIPKARFLVNNSLKAKIPTQTAVTGSMAPSTAVAVDPIYCTEYTMAILDITVDNRASISKSNMLIASGNVCMPPDNRDLTKKNTELKTMAYNVSFEPAMLCTLDLLTITM